MISRITRYAGIGGHHSNRAATVEWLTPPWVIEALGGWRSIDRDPCTPIEQPYPTALQRWTMLDDGLSKTWDREERHFVNPPYANGVVDLWLAKLADHGRGTALIFARTETDAFFRYVWERATAVLFMRKRINFHIGEAFSIVKTRRTYLAGDEADGNAGAPTVLCAYGDRDAEILNESGIEGQFVPLIFSRSVLVSAIGDVTWRELVVGVMAEADGPVHVAAVWEVVRQHPKAQGREHARAKVRQIMQAVGERVDRGQYRMAI